MLKISAESIAGIEKGSRTVYKVKVYFQEPEVYTEYDYLQNVGSVNTSMSAEGGYEIANTQIILKNLNYYFSRKSANELPVGKLVEIFTTVVSEDILIFRGIVSTWELTEMIVTLNLNA